MTDNTTYFPEKGDYVLKIGQVATVNWISANINEVNIHLIKNCSDPNNLEKILIARYPSYNGKNSYSFTVEDSFFSERYFSTNISVESVDSNEIIKYTQTFKILREG